MARRGHTLIDTYKDEAPPSFQNNFTAGLKTEHTGLNFPPNAATDTDNCIYTMLGDVLRREGFDYEANFVLNTIDRTNKAMATYRWLNVGGDGETQVYVLQIGNTLYFFQSSSATVASPLSTTKLSSTVTLSTYLASGSSADPSITECQFTDGNGYLFVFHPNLESLYCTFSAGTVSANVINIKIRDFNGIPEPNVPDTVRLNTITDEHLYNLLNQGWTKGGGWSYFGDDPVNNNQATPLIVGSPYTWTISTGLTITNGDTVVLGTFFNGQGTGDVFSYNSGTGVIVINVLSWLTAGPGSTSQWAIYQTNKGFTTAWFTAEGNYPSNSDVWWAFKSATTTTTVVGGVTTTVSANMFDPGLTMPTVTTSGPAPKGSFILDAFNQTKDIVSGITGLTAISTVLRPKTGAWFQGRVWYAGVDSSQPATGDAPYFTWTENIYFSQIVQNTTQFSQCYQTDDPTDENLFLLLPSDGGVITIQGSGSIYKLFPIQNGMIVFAANGIWFITGSTGIGFTANDYTITKISSVQSISPNSFVDVQGLPIFWNEEGIYTITPAQQGLGLTVSPLTIGTIKSFYDKIPLDSKKYVKGAYNPIDYVLQWVYRSTQETDITSRYEYDSILCLNVFTKAFYPYTIPGPPHIHGITYIASPGGSAAPDPTFKYVCSSLDSGSYKFTFAEERDINYVDWFSHDSVGVNFISYFVTGFQLDGQGLRKWQPTYVAMHSRTAVPVAYTIQGIWDFATDANSGKFSSIQEIQITAPYHGMVTKRHKIRGHGLVMQMKISSVDGVPFDIMGWTMLDTMQMGA